MLSYSFAIVCSFILSFQFVLSAPSPEKRATCNADNLLNAFRNRIQYASPYCSSFLSIPLYTSSVVYTATFTTYATATTNTILHPLQLWNFQRITTPITPLSYNSASPTPSTVPGNAWGYPLGATNKRRENSALPTLHQHKPRDIVTFPSYTTSAPNSRISSACSCLSITPSSTYTISTISTTTLTSSTCTIYHPSPTKTLPAICGPSNLVNSPGVNSHASIRVSPNFSVPSKLDCCAACTQIFNCVWWKFDFASASHPDPWAPGTCHYAYYIGDNNKNSDTGNQAAVCPNGLIDGLLQSTVPAHTFDQSLNATGYNAGACAGDAAYEVFQSDQDSGCGSSYCNNAC